MLVSCCTVLRKFKFYIKRDLWKICVYCICLCTFVISVYMLHCVVVEHQGNFEKSFLNRAKTQEVIDKIECWLAMSLATGFLFVLLLY